MERTLTAETKNKIGEKVKLQGWVENLRPMGKIVFIDLRDRSGIVQCIGEKEMKEITLESVVEITGTVKERMKGQENEEMETGKVEIGVEEYKILNLADALPIPVRGDGYDISEEARLKHRYLDLRRERVNNNIKFRSEFMKELREGLYEKEFTEIETPILTYPTMEGARDFVVPSRIHPGKFYALPQSPQQYKQLLMTGGFERYFQFARCIRDEDLRADRGFEFTQLDLEMSFVKMEDVMETVEEVTKRAVKAMGGKLRDENFPRIPYPEAMEKYGADKFDMRNEEEKEEGLLAFAWVVNFPFFKKVDTEDAAEVRDGKSGWTFTHNPFSTPIPEHIKWLEKKENIDKIVTAQYDLVCNGFEVGGGSIRAHRPEHLRAVYQIMGYSDAEIEQSIGHMLRAFKVGTPPHGGIALGIDRLVMLLTGEKNLKDIFAFPMTYRGNTAVMNAPTEISEDQLKELGLELRQKVVKGGKKVAQAIRKLLDQNNIKYKYEEHEAVVTSEDAARVRGTKLEEGAKAIVFRGKNTEENYMVVLPATRKVDIKAVQKEVGEELEMEKPEVILEKYGIEVGGVPPFGPLLGIQTFLDTALLQNEKVDFNCGERTCSIDMKAEDLAKVLDAKEGEWSK